MPDHDMGTAHGKIRLDGDTRGTDKVNTALNTFQKAIEGIAGRIGGFVAAMDKIDRELRETKGEFDSAARAADKYDRAIDGLNKHTIKTSRSNKDFSDSLKIVHDRLRLVNDMAHNYIIPLTQVAKLTREFNRSGGGLSGLARAFAKSGALGAALSILKSRFLGIGAALQQAPAWNQNLARVANQFGLFTFAAIKAAKHAGKLGPILEKAFVKMTKNVGMADFALAGFRGTVGKFFGELANGTSAISMFLKNLDKIPTGAFQVAGGLALMQAGLRGLSRNFQVLTGTMNFLNNSRIGKALKFLFLPGVIASAAAVQAFDKSLVFLSNTFAGLWSGIKQLSGGFLAIPGIISTVGAAALPLVAIVKTISSNVKDLAKAYEKNDAKAFAEALAQIPPYLRPVALAIVDVIPKLKSLGDVLTATFVSGGFDVQIKKLADTYLPALSIGAIQVANSWKILLNHVLEFASEAQTIGDVNHLFMNTSQIMNTVGDSLKPVLNGLRDIGIVGSTFIRNLAEDYLPGLADKFEKWADKNRQAGKLMEWMNNSVHAVKDLYHGFDDLIQATWKLLTLFQTKSGDTFLDRFANSMHKFHDSVNKSASGGELKKIADIVKGMGDDKIKQFVEIFKDFLPILNGVLKTLGQIGAAFSTTMVPAIEALMAVLTPLIQGFNAIGGGTIIGMVLGLAGAFKILMGVIGPVFNIFKVFFGAFLTLRGSQNLVLGLVRTLEKLGPVGQAAANGITNIGGALAKGLRAAGYAAAAFAIVIDVWLQGNQEIRDSQRAIQDEIDHTRQRVGKLRDAFIVDKGLVGDNVVSALTDSVKQSMSDLQNTVDKGPGVMAHIKNFFAHGITDPLVKPGKGLWDEGSEINDLQDQVGKAGRILAVTRQAMKDTGISSDDLGKSVSGTSEAWAKWIAALSATKQGGATDEALQHWQQMRKEFDDLQRSFAQAGPGAIMVAEGISKMASAAGDTTTKLQGLKQALQGLGLLKQDAYEAAFNYAQAIRDLGDAAANAVDRSQPLNDILDKQSGLFNTSSVNGRNLYNVLQPIAEKFLAAAASGKDANQLWADMQGNLHTLAQAFGLTDNEITKLVQSLGVVPNAVNILVKVSANPDKMAQEIGQLLAVAMSNVGNGVEVPVFVKGGTQEAAALAAQIQALFHDATAARADGTNVWLKPGIDQAALDKLAAYLKSNYNIDLGSVTSVPISPGLPQAQIPQPTQVAPPPLTPVPGAPPTPPKADQPKPAPGAAQPKLPPGMPAPVAPPGSRAAQVLPQQGTPAVPTLPAPQGTPTPAIPGADTAGAAASLAQLGQVRDALTVTSTAFTDFAKVMKDTFDQIQPMVAKWSDDAVTKLGLAANAAKTAGAAFSANFAQGIRDGLPLIDAAAKAAAAAAANKMPHSPAKEGPLSGRGWSGYAGTAFSTDFAQGISGGVGAVATASEKVAGKARGALSAATPYGKFGFEFKGDGLGRIRSILSFMENAVSTIGQLTDMGQQVSKILMDPMGFFTGRGNGINGSNNTSTGGANSPNSIGKIMSGGASSLMGMKNPSKEDIAAAIAGEAQNRGYDRNTAISVISAAMQESGIDPNITNLSGHHGLFQQSKDKPLQANASEQIQWMFNQLDQLGGPNAAGLKNNPLDWIASQIERGGYGGAALAQHSQAAANLYDRALTGASQVGVGPWANAPFADNPASMASHVPIAPNVESGIAAMGGLPRLYQGDSLPPWMQQLASAFGLTASTRSSGGSLHQMGFAADFNSPTGNQADLERFAQYISGNLSKQTLQLIYQNPQGLKYGIAGGQAVGPGTSQPNYYAGDFGGHGDHVHWATDVAPILAGANANAMPAAAGNGPMQQGGQNNIFGGQQQQSPQIFGDQNTKNTTEGVSGVPGQMVQQQTDQSAQSVTNQTQQVFGMISSGISAATNIASDVIGTIQAGVDAWGATKYIADELVRGVSSTEDIFGMVDQIQKYVTFAAKIAQTTGDVLNQIGSIVSAAASAGSADPTGGAGAGLSAAATAIQGAAQIASLVSAGLSTFNAIIDLGQEAYRIFGSYFGQFLGSLVGGSNSLMGDVKFLLDTNTGTLYNYSTDNPMLKQAHGFTPGSIEGTHEPGTNQVIGQLNYFAGPGQDPRDSTRQMMYQVKASQMAGATAQ